MASQGQPAYPHKADHYTYRVPTPPRIVVPPPRLNDDAMPDISLSAQRGPHDFLHAVDYNNIIQQNAPLEWTYERRRQGQAILPYLYLGPMVAAKDEAWLRENGITMVLGVHQRQPFAQKLVASALRVADGLGLENHSLDIADLQDLIHSFPQTTALINDHLRRSWEAHDRSRLSGRVLVFCESGNDRSAGVIAAYLMETHDDVDYIKAMQLCQAQRFCVSFDDSMKRVLQAYWDILCARRAVHGPVQSTTASPSDVATKKRVLAFDDESDEDMSLDPQQADDLQRFNGRHFAPFVDEPGSIDQVFDRAGT